MNDPPSPRAHAREPTERDGSLIRTIRNWLKGIGRARDGESWRETVEELIEDGDEGVDQIDPEERTMLGNLLRFGNLRAHDVMLPRPDIVAVEEGATLDEVVGLIKSAGHSRMPVYRDTLDEIVGVVHVRDVVALWGSDRPFKLSAIIHQILFAPPSMGVVDLLREMRVNRIHMAVVVDEYGGTDGLVTIEDLVEEIVGEIEDEHDVRKAPALVVGPDGSLDADARTSVEDLEARLGETLRLEEREEGVDTLGGLVSALAGRVPRRGERIIHPSGIEFEVLDADPRRIKRLRVRHAKPPAAAPE